MTPEGEYEPPEVGTVFRLRSRYAEDARLEIVRKMASALEDKGLITEDMKPVGYSERLRIRLDEYVRKIPARKHEGHWIDGGAQVAVFNPDTFFPFFFNHHGSQICRLCDGISTVGQIVASSAKERPTVIERALTEDIIRFLLLLEELDLIEFVK